VLKLVLTTEADAAKADALAQALVERRLAACVSQHPIRSCYRWNGVIEHSEEVQLLIKTTEAAWPQLQPVLCELHSYDTPELLHWRVEASDGYGGWVVAELLS